MNNKNTAQQEEEMIIYCEQIENENNNALTAYLLFPL